MVNNITVGIAKALAYFKDAKVYIDTVEQGLETPCFLIRSVGTTRFKRTSGHYKIIPSFAITYITNTADDLNTVIGLLPVVIDQVKAGDSILTGTNINISADASEHTLTCSVNYPYTVKKIAEKGPVMSKLSLAERIKR